MIISIVEENYKDLFTTLFVVGISWIVVSLSILIDFISGIEKAKQRKERITSHGIKRTIRKTLYYLAVMTFAGLFDLFNVITPYFFEKPIGLIPFFSILACLGFVFTEFKSVREKAFDKVKTESDESFKEMVKLLRSIRKNEDILNNLYDKMKEQDKNKKNE